MMTMLWIPLLLLTSVAWTADSFSFLVPNKAQIISKTSSSSSLSLSSKDKNGSNDIELSRRDSIVTSIGFVSAVLLTQCTLPQQPAWAAPISTTGITDDEKVRIKRGYDNILYLLNNFDQETTTCRENGGECKRDADAIRRALGLRSTTDPFFQIEKVFAKAKYMDIDLDKMQVLFEASEDWNSAISMSNSMAFISQFGEYNPGGGKDTVLKYLTESRIQVELARTALEKIMDSLEIPR
jgi:hypothetical protein